MLGVLVSFSRYSRLRKRDVTDELGIFSMWNECVYLLDAVSILALIINHSSDDKAVRTSLPRDIISDVDI